MVFCTLTSDRLTMRKFASEDAFSLHSLANDIEVADTCLLPHPYTIEMAFSWIDSIPNQLHEKGNYIWAIINENSEFIGTIGLHPEPHNKSVVEIGYWLGKKYWGRGYITEAIAQVVRFGFRIARFHKIYAKCFPRNTASLKALESNGFTREGMLKSHIRHFEKYEDTYIYSMLDEEYKK